MPHIGYARVSTREQETHLQIDALRAAGVSVVYQEKTSSVGSRPELQKCLAQLRPGDVLVVYKIDRIARSLSDLLAILERIRLAGALVRSLTEPLDTTSAMGAFVIQILGAVAQLERGIIRERSIAGQRAAVARGAVVGRRRALSVQDEAEAVSLYLSGLHTFNSLAQRFRVSASVIKRAVYRVRSPGHSSLK
jgi:DNA invertase Pin-like site-specific DNA recombinase